MKLNTPEIAWHGKEPILSVDFSKVGSTWRLASAGADNDVKIWSVVYKGEEDSNIEFLANLSRHTKAVNVVRFSPKEEMLASGGDDCMIIVWKLNSSTEHNAGESVTFMETDDVPNKESWSFYKALRGHIEDVYDLAWSPDGNSLVSGSVDNSAIVWDVIKGQKLMILKDHKHYVQGVCWDPLGNYIVTNSSDRSCRLYNTQYRCCYNITKLQVNGGTKMTDKLESLKQGRMFHDETMPSFFRRPSYSPDGSLLFVPAGRLDIGEQVVNTTYVFNRLSPNKPVLYLPSPQKATVAVRCCPILFELWPHSTKGHDGMEKESTKNLFKLPYRMVFAVATLDSILLYDTQQRSPFGFVSNIHYAALTDITWSSDGSTLVVSSSDGYCSLLHFKDGELGNPCNVSVKDIVQRSISPLPQNTSDMSGNLSKKILLTPVSNNPCTGVKADDVIQFHARKETASRITSFTFPTKATSGTQTTPKRITPIPIDERQTTKAYATTINQITPRRVALLPAPNNQTSVVTNENKPTSQVVYNPKGEISSGLSHVTPALTGNNKTFTSKDDSKPGIKVTPATGGSVPEAKINLITPRRVKLLPVQTSQPLTCAVGDQDTKKQVTPKHMAQIPIGTKDGKLDTTTSVSPDAKARQVSTSTSGAPRRIQLTTLTSDAGVSVPYPGAAVPPTATHGEASKHNHVSNSPSSKPDHHRQSAKIAVPVSTQVTSASQVQPLTCDDQVAKASDRNQKTAVMFPKLLDSSKSDLNQSDKENRKTDEIKNSESKPRRVPLKSLESKNPDHIVVPKKDDYSHSQPQLPSKRPIPLEPTIVVLD